MIEDLLQQEQPKLEPIGEGKSGAMKGVFSNGVRVIVKYSRKENSSGATQQRGLSIESLPGRAVAFYRLAQYLGPEYSKLVTETAITEVGGKPALVQLWADAFPLKKIDPRLKKRKHPEWVGAFREVVNRVHADDLRRAVILDCIAGSRDRHANNFGLSMKLTDQGLLWNLRLWDNDCAFGLTWEKYHNVLHKYRFTQAIDCESIWPTLERVKLEDLELVLGGLISPEAIDHTYKRVQFLLEFPYRMPYAVLTRGQYDPNLFPPYAEYFK